MKSLGKRARDNDALNLMMGHKDASIGKIYDHEPIAWRRIRRVAKVVYCQLWPKIKQKAETKPSAPRMKLDGGDADVAAAA
jgi:hypothetical protein